MVSVVCSRLFEGRRKVYQFLSRGSRAVPWRSIRGDSLFGGQRLLGEGLGFAWGGGWNRNPGDLSAEIPKARVWRVMRVVWRRAWAQKVEMRWRVRACGHVCVAHVVVMSAHVGCVVAHEKFPCLVFACDDGCRGGVRSMRRMSADAHIRAESPVDATRWRHRSAEGRRRRGGGWRKAVGGRADARGSENRGAIYTRACGRRLGRRGCRSIPESPKEGGLDRKSSAVL